MQNSSLPKVAGGVLPVSSHRYLRSPFFGYYDGPAARYGVYNLRLYPLDLGGDAVAEYWALRREAMLYDVPERPLEISGPDAVRLLDRVLVRRCGSLGVGRAAYGLACDPDGGLLMDGVLLRIATDRFWYVMADGEFLPWLEAHAMGLDVRVFDPQVWVLQLQGPRSLEMLRAVVEDPLPADWRYFAVSQTRIAGQPVVVSRTGWTGELGCEIYTPIDGACNGALWDALLAAGARFGALASMAMRRVEAGILDYGTDFDRGMNPWQAGLGRFVDMEKPDFIGRAALLDCDRSTRLSGIRCASGVPRRGAPLHLDGTEAGHVSASVFSPQLGCGIGYARFHTAAPAPGTVVEVETERGPSRAETAALPFYDAEKRIARGLPYTQE